MLEDYETRMKEFCERIDEGDRAIAAGHVTSYDSPETLTGADRQTGQSTIRPKHLDISEPAQADLTDIYTYIALADPAAAERFVDDLVCQMYIIAELGLSESPGACRWARPSAAAGSLRSI